MAEDDFPTKADVNGGRHKKRNPYANKLRDKKYRQRVVEDKNARRKRRSRVIYPGSHDDDWDSDL